MLGQMKIQLENVNKGLRDNKVNMISLLEDQKEKIKQKKPITLLSCFNVSRGPQPGCICESSDSDSQSIDEEYEKYPSLRKVAQIIRLQILQQTIPTYTILPSTPPKSRLLIQNISITLSISQFLQFVTSLPVKGFIQDVNAVYYNSMPSLLITLKTNQPQIVSAQLQTAHNQRFMRQMLGCDWKAVQITEEKLDGYYGVFFRKLDFDITSDEIKKICIECINDHECVLEINNEVLDVEGIGCMVVALKTLDQCETLVNILHQTNLNGICSHEVLVNIDIRSSKQRINKESSHHQMLFRKPKLHYELSKPIFKIIFLKVPAKKIKPSTPPKQKKPAPKLIYTTPPPPPLHSVFQPPPPPTPQHQSIPPPPTNSYFNPYPPFYQQPFYAPVQNIFPPPPPPPQPWKQIPIQPKQLD